MRQSTRTTRLSAFTGLLDPASTERRSKLPQRQYTTFKLISTFFKFNFQLAAEGKRGLFVVTSNDSYQKLLKDLELCGVAKSQILLVTCTNQARDYSVLQKCHPKWTQLDDLYQRLKVQEDLEKYKSEMSKPKHNTSFDLRQIEAIQKEISALHNSINFDLFRHINIFVRSIDRQGLVEHFFNEIYKLDFQIVLNGKFAVFEYEYVSLLRQVMFFRLQLYFLFRMCNLIIGPKNDNYRGYYAEIFLGENVAPRTSYQKSGFLRSRWLVPSVWHSVPVKCCLLRMAQSCALPRPTG
jgi:hypothetical protein